MSEEKEKDQKPNGNGREDKIARRARLREVAKHVAKLTDEQRAELASRVSITTIEGRQLS